MVEKLGHDDFERLVRENQRVVYAIALSVVGNAMDAQDVAQDAFIRAFAKLQSLRDPQRFRAWVCRISRRLALNRVRFNSRLRKRDEVLLEDASAVVDVESVAADREFEQRVRVAIDGLPEKFREVVLLCGIDGLEPSEVASILGVPAGTVRSRLHAARKRLMQGLSS